MFKPDNYIFDLLMKDINKRSKDFLYTTSTKIKDFDIEDFLKKHMKTEPEVVKDSVKEGSTNKKYEYHKTETNYGLYTIMVEVPGFTKEDIEINLIDGKLTIVGTSKLFSERSINNTIAIGNDKVTKVELDLGILYINCKEVKQKDKSKKINID